MKNKWRYQVVHIKYRWIFLSFLAVGLVIWGMQAAQAKETYAAAQAEVPIPVVMYHSLLKDVKYHGEYVISPDTFEKDLIYLKEHGYQTITIQDLIAYVNGASLPEKPVMITFDDGYYNNYLYAWEIAKRQECKLVISPIVSVTELFSATDERNAYYSHLTWQMLKEMSDSGWVEVQNHSYDMHTIGARKGIKKKQGETDEAYEQALRADLLKAQDEIEKNVGKRPTALAYPFGAMSKNTPALIKKLGFSATLTSAEKISTVTREADSLYGLGRFVRPAGLSSAEFFRQRMKLPD